jgi:hypothetical protein
LKPFEEDFLDSCKVGLGLAFLATFLPSFLSRITQSLSLGKLSDSLVHLVFIELVDELFVRRHFG